MKLWIVLSILSACGNRSSEPASGSSTPAIASDAAAIAAVSPDAKPPTPDAAPDAASPPANTVVEGFELAPGEALWRDDTDKELVNPIEWKGVKLALVTTPDHPAKRIGGKLRALVDGKSVDLAAWEIDASVIHWALVSVKNAGTVLRFGSEMNLDAPKGSPEMRGNDSFVELVFDPKTKRITTKRTWSGGRIDTPPAWANLHIKHV